ncbi:unnamed protein product, partial [Mesorhabditis belari]|uniref:Uncharacterized protein n=1 Tax=Mesorhabditis belari TaxID=2138241 RepID=A0AAF3EMU7_9BILA
MTPLHLTAQVNAWESAVELLQGNTLGSPTKLDEILEEENENGESVLHFAARSGCLNVVEELLKKKVVRQILNATAAGNQTPLHVAARNDHAKICEVLLRKGANPYARADGMTPFDLAIMMGSLNSAEVLRKYCSVNGESVAVDDVAEIKEEATVNKLSMQLDSILMQGIIYEKLMRNAKYKIIVDFAKDKSSTKIEDKNAQPKRINLYSNPSDEWEELLRKRDESTNRSMETRMTEMAAHLLEMTRMLKAIQASQQASPAVQQASQAERSS